MLCDVRIACDLLSALEFQRVALAVSEADGIGDKTGIFADCQAGCGIEATAEQDDRFVWIGFG